MEPKDDKTQEHFKALEEIQDRMMKAGLITRHAHFEDTNRRATEFTPDGQRVVSTIYSLDKALGPLTQKQIVYFWNLCVEIAEQRIKSRT